MSFIKDRRVEGGLTFDDVTMTRESPIYSR
jgi:hypothetical protein